MTAASPLPFPESKSLAEAKTYGGLPLLTSTK
jgi:hypothetical protein